MVWRGILVPKTLQAHAVVLQEEWGLVSQHQIRHIVGQIKELSVGCSALQPDIGIKEMMLMQEKQYGMPQHLVSCTGL